MKKTLLIAAAAMAALAGNAETYTYDFNTNPAFCNVVMNPESDLYVGEKQNYDFIDKYGKTNATAADGLNIIYVPEGAEKGEPRLGYIISLLDGQTYRTSEDVVVPKDFEVPVADEAILAQPFIGWGEKGVTRTILMQGWGSTDGFKDENYNGATEADWVSTKNGIAFNRLGTDNMVSRTDTYIQFPEVTGNVTITIWAGSASDSSSKNQNINVLVTPVVDGVVDEANVVNLVKETGTFVEKRMYKMDPVTKDYTGKKVAFRVGCNGNILHVYHVVIEGDPVDPAGIEDVIAAPAVDENAPVYNIMGQRVNESYKGLVIKNGVKYVQK